MPTLSYEYQPSEFLCNRRMHTYCVRHKRPINTANQKGGVHAHVNYNCNAKYNVDVAYAPMEINVTFNANY